ncbi:hypothetical protein OH77DRAFT_1586687 [Trametes cingulata]|nr:hypothetical protein OH77DRAFT_1586687 [Trametes cingulata]
MLPRPLCKTIPGYYPGVVCNSKWRPCDEEGNYLAEGTPPPPRPHAAFGDWSPFDNRIEFELAEFLFKREQMSARSISVLMSLWAADVIRLGGRPPFADYAELYATIDAITLGDVPWRCLKAGYRGPRPTSDVPSWMDETYEIWYRDPRQIALRMLGNPDFDGEFDYAPYREFTRHGDRRYCNFMSGNWAWLQADTIVQDHPEADGALFVPVLLGSDKTTVSVATGQNDYYPLYMSIGNIHNNVRRAHRESVILIAFLAIPKADRRHADTPAFRRFRRQLFHSSLSAILQSLKPGMTVPEVARCPDTHYRRVIWGIGAYIADYMEQVLVACIVQGWCPTCLKPSGQLDAPRAGDKRSRMHTEALIRTFEPSVLWDDYGVLPDVVPFTNDFPRADIYELLSGDLLHQLIKGTFKDHLVTWVGQYLILEHGEARGKELLDEIDRRLSLVPPFPGLRHFKQGRDFKQWTGDDSKALMKIYLPPIAHLLPSKMVRAVASFLELCYICRRNVILESDLQGPFNHARSRFHADRKIFQDTLVRPDGFSLPRQHSLEHYDQHIRNFAAPNGLCTSITEAKHIKAVKEPWRRSNRYEPLGQMLLTNQRLDKLAAARADFEARGMLEGTCLGDILTTLQALLDDSPNRTPDSASGNQASQLSDRIEGSGGHAADCYSDELDESSRLDRPHADEMRDDNEALSQDSGDEVPVAPASSSNPLDDADDDDEAGLEDSGVVPGPRLSGFVVLPQKHQRRYPNTLSQLSTFIGVPNLCTLVARFLYQQRHPKDDLPDDEDLLPCPSNARVRVYHSAIATFYAPSDPSGIGGMHREHIRATPSWRKGPPRYDCVFIGKDPHADGFRSLHAARVRLFFSVFAPPSEIDSEPAWVPCALVEWFSPVGDEPDEDTGLWVVEPDYEPDGTRARDVVHLQSLLRTAHLIPVFGRDPTPTQLKQHEVLDSYRAFYVNKYADHHAHEIAY